MDLEDYWGIGPKTRETLETSLGTDRAVEAIESGDLFALVEAGVGRGRATRILRRAAGGADLELLATQDTRDVYNAVLDLIAAYAVNDQAAAHIRTMTPLRDRQQMQDRQETIVDAREAWQALSDTTQTAVLDAFKAYDEAGGDELAAVRTVVRLHEIGVSGSVFEPVLGLDADRLADAATALAALDGQTLDEGTDEQLDRLRGRRDRIDELAADVSGVVEDVRSGNVRGTSQFREGLIEFLRQNTAVDPTRVRNAMPAEAMDATSFVNETLRTLRRELNTDIENRAQSVRSQLQGDIAAVESDIDQARSIVDRLARNLSIARFADEYDLVRPAYVDRDGIAVEGARSLTLLAGGETVQPIRYSIGDHTLSPPQGDRVAVLTGANSGGKTTLLETLCQITVLARMGLPVPATQAEVGHFDRVVFHRRHASFNAGVLESTLQSIVPPLTAGTNTLMLVDEFEAITEPGRAADLLHGLVQLTVDRGALGVFVTHLADDLAPLPSAARIDGIFAQGLTPDLELNVDYQPQFGEVGRSTPEFIVSRLVANARDRDERAAFSTLAQAVDTDVVQRTLADARWSQS